MNIAVARTRSKYTDTAGLQPTVPTSADHKDGSWLNTDIYRGEIFINVTDKTIFTRDTSDNIIEIGSGAMQLNDLTDVTIDTGLLDGDVLQYDATSGQWINVQFSGGLWATGAGTGSAYLDNSTGNDSNGAAALSAGQNCSATGARSIAMGQTCAALGDTSVAMGASCTATEDFSRAIGAYSTADDELSEVFASGDFGTGYRGQYGRAVMMVSTEASSPTKALLGTQDHIKINQNHAYHFRISAVAFRTDGAAAYTNGTEHCLVKDIAGTTTIVDSTGIPVLLDSGDAALAAIYIDVAVDSGKFCIIVVDDTLDDLLINWTIFVEWTVAGCEQA